jgi:phage terminase small subunit
MNTLNFMYGVLNMALSARRAKFVDEYILDFNGSRAARSAGYAVSGARVTAHRLLTDANVNAAIVLKQQELAHIYGLSKHSVVKELLVAVDIASEKLDPGNMIKAWCEISKILGISGPETVKIEAYAENEVLRAKYEAMTDDELMTIVGKH